MQVRLLARVRCAAAVVLAVAGSLGCAELAGGAGNGFIAAELRYTDCSGATGFPTAVAADTDCSVGSNGIVVVRPDGTGARRLPLLREATDAQFSGDGALLSFFAWDDSLARFGLFVATSQGAGVRAVDIAPSIGWAETYRGLDWSPRGRSLVFGRMAGGTSYIHRFDGGGSRSRRLRRGSEPMWSPAGDWIAYVRGDRVMVMRPGGGPSRGWTGYSPMWSPAASRLAFLRTSPAQGGRRVGLFVARPGRRGARQVAAVPAAGRTAVIERWSYDRRSVIVQLVDPKGETASRYVSVDASGGEVSPFRPSAVGSTRQDGVLSPDGRLVAYGADDGVHVARRDGAARRRVLRDAPRWHADWFAVTGWQPIR